MINWECLASRRADLSYGKFLDYIKSLSPKLFEVQPPFKFSGDKISEKCRKSSQEFTDALNKFELWALRSEFFVRFL